jgi:hypothetical protein
MTLPTKAFLAFLEAPASLWTPTEALVPFYGRVGFELLSRHDVDGAFAFWMMRATSNPA